MELAKIVPTDAPGILRLVGELDASNVEGVQARLEQEFADAGHLIVEMSEVTFSDSQGIRMLISLGERAGAQSSVILILNCSQRLRRSVDVAVPGGIPGAELFDAERY
jgi:anti-anti-sigma factor